MARKACKSKTRSSVAKRFKVTGSEKKSGESDPRLRCRYHQCEEKSSHEVNLTVLTHDALTYRIGDLYTACLT
jgi:ribosomal protein L35